MALCILQRWPLYLLILFSPAYIKKFTGNEYIINMVPALSIFTNTAPQIFIARYVECLTHRKRLMLITAVMQRIPWLILSFIVLLNFNGNQVLPLLVFFLFYLSCLPPVPDLICRSGLIWWVIDSSQ